MITSKINKTRIRAHDALVPWVLSQVIFSLLFIILYSDFYNVSKEKPNYVKKNIAIITFKYHIYSIAI